MLDMASLEHSVNSCIHVLSTMSDSLNLSTALQVCRRLQGRAHPPGTSFSEMERAISKGLLDQCLTAVLLEFVLVAAIPRTFVHPHILSLQRGINRTGLGKEEKLELTDQLSFTGYESRTVIKIEHSSCCLYLLPTF